MNKIGGDFTIDVDDLKFSISNLSGLNDCFSSNMFSSGRSALLYILEKIDTNKDSSIYLPDYICPSVISTLIDNEYDILFYSITKELSLDRKSSSLKSIDERSIVLLVDYFGLVDLTKDIEYLKSEFKCRVVTDCVQAFWSLQKYPEADYSFSSLRKSFAVPDGALVWNGRSFEECSSDLNHFFSEKLLGAVLKKLSVDNGINDHIYLDHFKRGEVILNSDKGIYRASEHTVALFSNIDCDRAREKRLENAYYVNRRCAEVGIPLLKDISEDSVPLFVPVLLKNRNVLREKLFDDQIYLPVHWPSINIKEIGFLSQELSLVIDQRYSKKDMKRMMDKIIEYRSTL